MKQQKNTDCEDLPYVGEVMHIDAYTECPQGRCSCEYTWFERMCALQSEEIVKAAQTEPQTTTQDLVSFVEQEQQRVDDVTQATPELARDSAMDVGDLQKFLERPVRILNRTWAESDTTGYVTSIYPWYEYLNSAFIKKKIDNYAWFRANLHLKVVVNASPFYYGLAMFSYNPLQDYNGAGAGASGDAWYANGFVQRSQRPHIMVLPQDSLGGEVTLPFIWPREYIDLQSASEAQALGRLELEILVQLASANGVSGTGVSLQVFAWMSDVELVSPSLGLALQSDEYTTATGPVSSVATSVASFANKFIGMPVFGKFAKATSIGAGAVGAIASLFGFTNVNVIEATAPRRINAYPPLASAQVGYPCEKLSFDPKAELSIDGAAMGLDTEDELVISRLAQKQSIMTITNWQTSDLVDAQILTMGINPFQYKLDSNAASNIIRLPPVSWLATMFDHWRGDLIVRFDVIASRYHRGRLLFTYDPSGTSANNVVNTPNPTGIITTHILDIGVARSIELTIPYAQAVPWLRTQYGWASSAFASRGSDGTSANFFGDKQFFNGNLTCRVLNALTAPVGTSTVGVVVSIRGAENLEFANPRDPYPFATPWQVQSREEVFPHSEITVSFGKPSEPDPHRFDVNWGEPVRSLRTLMQRYSLNEVWVADPDTMDAIRVDRHVMTRYPLPWGFDPCGAGAATAPIAAATKPFNLTKSHVYNFIAPAFAAVRGSFNWTFVPLIESGGQAAPHNLTVKRVPATQGNQDTDQVVITTNTHTTPLSAATGAWGAQNNAWFKPCRAWFVPIRGSTAAGPQNDTIAALTLFSNTTSGAASAVDRTSGGLSVTMPHYNNTLFDPTNPSFITNPLNDVFQTAGELYQMDLVTFPNQGQSLRCTRIEKWCGAGADLSLTYFINTPILWSYFANPAVQNTAV